MLDLMRRHASSWLIKVILGAIIVSFVFFFGYSSYRKGMRGGRVGAQGAAVAKVNGTPVSESEFEFFFDRNFERMKQSFGGKEIPAFVRQLAEGSTLQQLVGREVALQLADGLGIAVSDAELADTIRQSQAAQMGGEFDPIAYRHTFLPSFRSRHGMDFEQFVRQDLRLSALQDLLSSADRTPLPGDGGRPSATWAFETITVEGGERPQAERIIATPPKEWPRLLKAMKLEAKKTGPLSIADRSKLLDGKGTLSHDEAIFSLTPSHPVLDHPLDIDGKWVVVRLVERREGGGQKKDEPPPPAEGLFQEWMGKLLAKAKVQNYLEKGEGPGS